ncbi:MULTISPECIES: Rid family detoxifying hydrolase [unclassified Prochlorococcus]|uniref:Rid family detoxifying hydrolase n=1 Tax=unclassified Prochlorococcus TaxID=2627481 RepID=UPI000533B78C|nr:MULTISPECIES: Rid family detoxifying hydrolase [unclassified Prochlorococcus]KGG16400.1 Endoribonuclease L-PSP [Prochlorococcus sp. MIT 0602]KGG17125.1 Endoribonuclease L-PSP [Prochlorococcus sp. MIT 0603]
MTALLKKAIESKAAPAPVGPYNQAILAGGWLYCSGQIALDPSTGNIVGKEDVEQQTHQVLKNLLEVLKAAGGDTSNVVRTTIYLVNLEDFKKVNNIYSDFFKNNISPARACIEVSALPKGGLVEIDCVAWLG